MEQRSATVEATRQRIVDATVELHNEKGVTGTSMQDIAERAGVALATVYRHFPTLEELIPACGSRNLERNPLPDASVLAGIDAGPERVGALVHALFAHYERGQRPYEVGFAEAVTLPAMRRLMAGLAKHVAALVTEATKPFKPSTKRLAVAVGLCDYRVWRSLTQAGLSTTDAANYIAETITGVLSRRTERSGRRSAQGAS